MHQGLYIAATGALNSMYRQDVAANNLANINTPGFKVDSVLVRQRGSAREEAGLGQMASSELLELLGGGVHGLRTHTGHTQGTITQTGNDLDVALQGDGFFVVRAGSDDSGDTLRLTRDGRFSLNSDGVLVNSEGLPVLNDSNDPIKLKAGLKAEIGGDGTISQGGQRIARLGVLTIDDPQSLRKAGASLYAISSGSLDNAQQSSAIVRQGSVEQSSVNPIDAIMAVSAAGKDAESNISMISRYDQMMERAINTFARLA